MSAWSGKGSRHRLGSLAKYQDGYEGIDFTEIVTCPHCWQVPMCSQCKHRLFGDRRLSKGGRSCR